VQLRPEARKRWTWPAYQAVLRARLRCPVEIVVLTLDEATARWCAAPIEIDACGSRVCPVVIGPSRVPGVTEVERARRHPEVALLGVLAHRHAPTAFALARTLLFALDDVDEVRARWVSRSSACSPRVRRPTGRSRARARDSATSCSRPRARRSLSS